MSSRNYRLVPTLLPADVQYRDESFTDVFTSPTIDTYEEFLQLNFRARYQFGDQGRYCCHSSVRT